jgi:Fe-S cluster biogenesis protein NfuA
LNTAEWVPEVEMPEATPEVTPVAKPEVTPIAMPQVTTQVTNGHTRTALSEDERSKRKVDLDELLELMRPSVQADGGDLALVSADVESGIVEVQLQGACSSCAISASTLQGGVERILMGRLDWITEVRGGVDESADPFESAALGQGGYVPRW